MDEIKINTMDTELPVWDLSEIYKDIDDPSIESDIKIIKELSENFSIQWKGKIKNLNEVKKSKNKKKIIFLVYSNFRSKNHLGELHSYENG